MRSMNKNGGGWVLRTYSAGNVVLKAEKYWYSYNKKLGRLSELFAFDIGWIVFMQMIFANIRGQFRGRAGSVLKVP